MNTGTIKFFNATKGYGFIKSDEKEYFFHVTNLVDKTVSTDDEVSFDLMEGKKGQQATNVRLIN